MKKKFVITPFIMILILSITISCDKDFFNFDNLSSVEASGEWGIPLINAQYSVGEMLNQLNSEDYITQSEDGSLFFNHEVEKEEIIITTSAIFNFADININETYNFHNSSVPGLAFMISFDQNINFQNDYLLIQNAEIKSGVINIQVNHNVDQIYSIELRCSKLRNRFGKELHIIMTSLNTNTLHQTIDLAGYTIIPDADNSVVFHGEISFVANSVSPIETYVVNCAVTINNFKLKSVYGKLAEYSVDFNDTTDLKLFSENYGGDFTIYNPIVTLYTKNSFIINGKCIFNTAEFSGTTGYSSLLNNVPVIVNIPVSPSQYHQSQIEGVANININTNYDKFIFTGKTILNPNGFDAGTVYIDENSTISLKTGVSIPFKFKIPNAYFTDTSDFKMNSVENMEVVESASIRVAIINTLPVNLSAQIYFYDSLNNSVKDSLFTHEPVLHGTYNNISATTDPIYVTIDKQKLERIISTDKIILRFKINTGNQEVVLKASQYVRAMIGLKVKYNTGSINLSDI